MTNKKRGAWALTLCLLLSSCIKDDLKECPPPDSRVDVRLYVEKFQTAAPHAKTDLEAHFGDRVQRLYYYLYRDGTPVREGIAEDLGAVSDSAYVLRFTELPMGNYRLTLVGNYDESVTEGSPGDPDAFFLVYPGADRTADYFTQVYPFTVDCTCPLTFGTVLERAQGVIRYNFRDIPAEATAIEVEMAPVGGRRSVAGRTDSPATAVRRFDLSALTDRSEASWAIGTFPTPDGTHTAWRLRVLAGDTPLRDRLVTDTLTVRRNQLLDLSVAFPSLDFSVDMDNRWDGSSEGGSGEIASL